MGVGFYKVTKASSLSTGDSDTMVNTGSTRTSKEKVTLGDLPYEQNKKNVQTWRNIFVPALLRWAGAQEDPFGTNSLIKEIVPHMWGSIFPQYALDEHGLSIVEAMVRLKFLYMGHHTLTVS